MKQNIITMAAKTYSLTFKPNNVFFTVHFMFILLHLLYGT